MRLPCPTYLTSLFHCSIQNDPIDFSDKPEGFGDSGFSQNVHRFINFNIEQLSPNCLGFVRFGFTMQLNRRHARDTCGLHHRARPAEVRHQDG